MYTAKTYIVQRSRSALVGYNPPISDERQFVNARAYLRSYRILKICPYTNAHCVYYIQFKVREAAVSVMPKEFKVTTAALYVIRVRTPIIGGQLPAKKNFLRVLREKSAYPSPKKNFGGWGVAQV